MALSLIIEEDRGTFAKRERRHNGYYGGDFSKLPHPTRPLTSAAAAGPRWPVG